MHYVISLAVIITGIALTGIKALITMNADGDFGFDARSLLVIVAVGMLLRHQWARITAMAMCAFAAFSIFFLGVRGTLNSTDLHLKAFWFESTSASVSMLWLICSMMIGYFFWSYCLLASKRSQRYFAS